MSEHLRPYVSDVLASWDPAASPTKSLSGAFMFADVSGFTALSESLQERGREGAELLNRIITDVLTGFIAAARRRGGDILAFGGDAILVHIGGDEPLKSAVVAAAEMQRSLDEPRQVEGLPPVQLGVSIGIHAGQAAALRIPMGRQVEAVVVGPTITRTLRTEGAAEAGQILVSHEAAHQLPAALRGEIHPDGVLVAGSPTDGLEDLPPTPAPPAVLDAEQLLSPSVATVAGTLDAHGRHRRVAVGFVRAARMDEVVADRGLEAAHDFLSTVTGELAAHAERTGAHVLTVDSYPDAVKMLVCAGAPVAADDNDGALIETLRATAAGLTGLDVHFGAHRGLAFAGDLGAPSRRGYTLLGDTVNLAARLMQRAGPGEVVATAEIVERTDAARTPLAPFRVKGKSDEIQAFRLDEGEAGRPIVDLPLVGRQREVDLFDELAGRALGGEAVAVDLVAEAGHGKSRLAREVSNRQPELEPFLGRATAYSAATPYSLVRRLLRVLLRIPRSIPSTEAGRWLVELIEGVAPDLMDDAPLIARAIDAVVDVTTDLPVDPATRRRRVARAVAELVRRVRPGPMLVLVDDVQWLDDASRQVLHRLASGAADRPWLFIAASRPGTDRLFDGLVNQEVVELEPLGETDAAELVRRTATAPLFDSQVDDVVARARGNCLFLVEYARSGDEDVPDDVESLIARRLDALEVEERRVLGIAAVVGTSPAIEIVRSVSEQVDGSGLESRIWRALGEWLEPLRGGVVTWRDPVFRDVAYAGLPYQRRRDLHRAVYAAIESSPSDESLARRVALALHADLGQMPQEAWDLLRKTGEEAAWSGSSVEAVDLLERAIRWVDELSTVPDSALVDTLRTLAQAADLAGRFETGLAAADRAASLCREPDELVRLHALRSRLHVQLGQIDRARDVLGPARDLATDQPPDVRASVLVAEAAALFRADQFGDAFALIREVADLGRDHVAPKDWVQAMILGDGIVGAGIEGPWEVGRGLPVAELLGDDRGVATCHNNLGIVAYRRGDWQGALEEWELAHAAHARGGSLVDAATSTVNIAEIRGDQGNWDAALERMESARQTWVAGDYRIGILFVTSLIGRTHARLGETFRADEELASAERGFMAASATGMAAEALVRRAEATWLAGRPRAALDQLDRAADIPADAGPLALLVRGCAQMAIGEATAAQTLEEALAAATAANRWYEQLAARAQLARVEGDEPANRPDVMELAAQLGIWRLAVPGGELRLSPPPGDDQSVESVS